MRPAYNPEEVERLYRMADRWDALGKVQQGLRAVPQKCLPASKTGTVAA